MNLAPEVRRWRDWFPVPMQDGQVSLYRWVILEANRMAVTGALLTFVFVGFLLLSMLWTFEMQNLLTETSTVQTLLNTFLSGMILLVSIVVSINSIVLSHDMSSVNNQEDRIQGAMRLRQDLSELTEPGEDPSDPTSFLKVMSRTIRRRAQELNEGIEDADVEFVEEVDEHATSIVDMADQLGAVQSTSGAEFAVLWKGMEFQYGPQMERSRRLKTTHGFPEGLEERFDRLIEAFELFAIGKEYFKTLYYTQEVSRLSHTLLVITLPIILINASTILAINAGVFPEFWFLGIPPLQSFVAASFTLSLAPYLVLTAYILRLSAVARLTSSAGIFSLN
jgi:hypothetical protein